MLVEIIERASSNPAVTHRQSEELISFDEAIGRVIGPAKPLATEKVALDQADSRYLARPVIAPRAFSDHYRSYPQAAKEFWHSAGVKVLMAYSTAAQRPSTVLAEDGEVAIEVPRDRAGTFEPRLIAKGQTRFEGFDDKIVSLPRPRHDGAGDPGPPGGTLRSRSIGRRQGRAGLQARNRFEKAHHFVGAQHNGQ